jgi:hypothetical protein
MWLARSGQGAAVGGRGKRKRAGSRAPNLHAPRQPLGLPETNNSGREWRADVRPSSPAVRLVRGGTLPWFQFGLAPGFQTKPIALKARQAAHETSGSR